MVLLRDPKKEEAVLDLLRIPALEDEPKLNGINTPPVRELTFNKSKSGTLLPWAIFDEWGAKEFVETPLREGNQTKLSAEMVGIPMNDGDRKNNEAEILEAYNCLLQQTSSVHIGYPYNLNFNHKELYKFIKYSINNLGDPNK